MNQTVDISFIIPAYNEEQNIEKVLTSIFTYSRHLSIEVIVIDNGSTDNTAEKVKNTSAKYLYQAQGNISALRNAGAKISNGDCLVFIDADVLLTLSWQQGINVILQALTNHPLHITGSRCLVEDDKTWLNKYWFCLLNNYQSSYINSGHLITSRRLFDLLSGFNETLETAEDYDFCMRAVKHTATIKEEKSLKVIHLGYPKNVFDFIQRERWHGRQDVNSLREFCKSKIAWLALFFLLQSLACGILAILSQSSIPIILSLACTYVLALILTIYKFKMLTLNIIPVALIFAIYLFGRSLAIVDKGLQQIKQCSAFLEKNHRGD